METQEKLGRIHEKLEEAGEWYVNKSLVRAVLVAVPYIGGSLDIIFSSRGSAIVQSRLLDFVSSLDKEMARIRESMVDKDFLESEEFFDLSVRALEYTTRTRDREKLSLYAAILRGATVIQDRDDFSAEEYLQVLAELSSPEIRVAKAIYEQQREPPSKDQDNPAWVIQKGWDDLANQCRSVPEEDLPFILLRLQRAGLIKEYVGAIVGYAGGVYAVTGFFRKLMRHLERTGAEKRAF